MSTHYNEEEFKFGKSKYIRVTHEVDPKDMPKELLIYGHKYVLKEDSDE